MPTNIRGLRSYQLHGLSRGSSSSWKGRSMMQSATRVLCFSAVLATTMALNHPAAASSVKFLHLFSKSAGGIFPNGGVVELGNALYGVLAFGGVKDAGAVFQLTLDGQETILHFFDRKTGQQPLTGLTVIGNMLYGTTSSGGTYNAGTVFSISPQGTFSTIHNFDPNTEGYGPRSTLLSVSNILYGVTLKRRTQRRRCCLLPYDRGRFQHFTRFRRSGRCRSRN